MRNRPKRTRVRIAFEAIAGFVWKSRSDSARNVYCVCVIADFREESDVERTKIDLIDTVKGFDSRRRSNLR